MKIYKKRFFFSALCNKKWEVFRVGICIKNRLDWGIIPLCPCVIKISIHLARFSHSRSLSWYFMRTLPVLTSMMQMLLPPQVATLDVVLSGACGSGSNTTSQIGVWTSVGLLFLLCERMKCMGS